MPFPFPYSPVIRECSWKKMQIKKNQQFSRFYSQHSKLCLSVNLFVYSFIQSIHCIHYILWMHCAWYLTFLICSSAQLAHQNVQFVYCNSLMCAAIVYYLNLIYWQQVIFFKSLNLEQVTSKYLEWFYLCICFKLKI